MGHGAVHGAGSRDKQGTIPLQRESDIWWNNISGWHRLCGAFIGGNREMPQVPGEMQCRMLGAAVEAWDARASPVQTPWASWCARSPFRPCRCTCGATRTARYLSSYFDMYPAATAASPVAATARPAWARCGAMATGSRSAPTRNGGCVIYGRSTPPSTATACAWAPASCTAPSRPCPRCSTAWWWTWNTWAARATCPVRGAAPRPALDDALRARINGAIRTALSPRFVPDDIFAVAEVPRTLSGKKQELPIKKLLLGQPIEKVVNKDAMANPGCLDWYVALARERAARAGVPPA
jgi:acetoacetyl-CoA synthetase